MTEDNTYDLKTLLDIKERTEGREKINLTTEAITRIKALEEYSNPQYNRPYGRQKYVRPNVLNENQNAFIRMSAKLDRDVIKEDSLENRKSDAQKEFNKLNRKNARDIAINMTSRIECPEISSIFFEAIDLLLSDQPERNDQWEYWINLLPQLNMCTKKKFQEHIIKKTNDEFNELIQKNKFNETDISNLQKIGCWISCLLVNDFIDGKKYAQMLHTVIKKLKLSEAAAVIHSSLSISGRRIDSQESPLFECWFLFTFLRMNMSKCTSFLRCQIIDLFELRHFEWNKARLQDHLDNYSNIRNPSEIKKTQNNTKINTEYQQKEYFESQFTKYTFHSDQYAAPLNDKDYNEYKKDKNLISKTLLSILIKQKGEKIDMFLSFAQIILIDLFKDNTNEFITTMLKIKNSFRKLFEGEDQSIKNENHSRYYKLIALFLTANWTDLYNYINNIFDVYLHVVENAQQQDNGGFIKKDDEIFLPIPSVFVESIYYISGTEDFLTPLECNEIWKNFSDQPTDFNKIIFKDNEYTIINREKVKLDDFWPFLSQLVYITNPDKIDEYFKDKDLGKFNSYEWFLLYYNMFYIENTKQNENFEGEFQCELQATFPKIDYHFGQDEKIFNDLISAVLDLLCSDDKTFDSKKKKELFDIVTHSLHGSKD